MAPEGRETLTDYLTVADVFIDDTPVAEREALGVGETTIAKHFPRLVNVSLLPFGATGPKAGWKGEDVVIHPASGEGNLLPKGMAVDMFTESSPPKIGRTF